MFTKYISSTQAQNNFGQMLDDVSHKQTRYIVKRRGAPRAVVLGFDDFMSLLDNDAERQRFGAILREVRPTYALGEVLDVSEPEGD